MNHRTCRTKNKRSFTLLEILVAITLLAITSGVIGWKLSEAIGKKQFQSQIERLKIRFTITQKMALAMQSDWKAVLKKQGSQWVLETSSEEAGPKKLAPLKLNSLDILFDGKKVDALTFDFFSSGQVLPEGKFQFSWKKAKLEIKTTELFEREEGKKLGPLHPNEK